MLMMMKMRLITTDTKIIPTTTNNQMFCRKVFMRALMDGKRDDEGNKQEKGQRCPGFTSQKLTRAAAAAAFQYPQALIGKSTNHHFLFLIVE